MTQTTNTTKVIKAGEMIVEVTLEPEDDGTRVTYFFTNPQRHKARRQ